jgi:hypothetical protein
MRELLIPGRFFLSVLLGFVGFSTAATPSTLPSDDVLQAKVLEVGHALGLTEAYRDPTEGLFVWRVTLAGTESKQTPIECPALFAWYLKRVDNQVALHDPMLLLCGANPRPEIRLETRRFQEEFKRRWLEAVGDVTLIPPTTRTHSQELEATVLGLLRKESVPRASRQPSSAPPDGFAWRELREINAAVLVPDGWYVKRVVDRKLTAAVAYFVTVENIDTRGSFDTGMSLNVLVARSRSEDVEAVAKARIAGGSCTQSRVLNPSWEVTDGVFHRYGCRVRVTGKAGPIVVDHRLIVNTKTKTMYIVDFESPESRWDDAWPKGAKLVDLLLLDESV